MCTDGRVYGWPCGLKLCVLKEITYMPGTGVKLPYSSHSRSCPAYRKHES